MRSKYFNEEDQLACDQIGPCIVCGGRAVHVVTGNWDGHNCGGLLYIANCEECGADLIRLHHGKPWRLRATDPACLVERISQEALAGLPPPPAPHQALRSWAEIIAEAKPGDEFWTFCERETAPNGTTYETWGYARVRNGIPISQFPEQV